MSLPSFSWPIWQLHHWIIVVPSFKLLTTRSNHMQQVARTSKKTGQWKLSTSCKTMTTVKTVAYIVQWVHMCPTACKWHATSYKWKQLTSNPKQWKWTSHELTSQDMKIQNCCNWQTPTNLWTASARWLDSFCKQSWIPWQRFPTQLMQAALNWQLLLFLGRLLHRKTCTSNNKNASKCKTTDALKFKWLALLWPWAALLCALGCSWLNLEAISTYSPS